MAIDTHSRMGLGRTLVVAAVMWGLFGVAMGVAAWCVERREAMAQPVKIRIGEIHADLPSSFVVDPVKEDDGVFRQFCLAESSQPQARALLGVVDAPQELVVQQVIAEVSKDLLQLKLFAPNGQADKLLFRQQVRAPRSTGPVKDFIWLLLKRAGEQAMTQYVVGATTSDNRQFVVLAMKFNISEQLTNPHTVNAVLRHNLGVYQAVAQTLVVKG